jgi:hypothetical protein
MWRSKQETIGRGLTIDRIGDPAGSHGEARDFHSKVRRTEDEKLGFALPLAGPVRPCAPNGAASHQTF